MSMSDKTHADWCLSHNVDESYVCNCGAETASSDEIQRALAWLEATLRSHPKEIGRS